MRLAKRLRRCGVAPGRSESTHFKATCALRAASMLTFLFTEI
jgi:hypothetical protein